EGDVPPAVRAELAGVVVGLSAPVETVLRDEVPLLAGDLAGLAADADGRVREEPHPLGPVVAVGGPSRRRAGELDGVLELLDDVHVFLVSSGSTRSAPSRSACALDRSPSA